MKRILILIIFTTLVLLSSLFGVGTVRAQAGNIEYYGYYAAPWPAVAEEADDDTTGFTNIVFLSYVPYYSQATLQNYVNHRKNQGHKVILSFTGYLYQYLYENKTIPDNVWREFLNGLKTKLGADKNKIYAFYLADEPNEHKDKDGDFIFRHNPERLEKIINITKEIFPDINTFIVFYTSWIRGGYIVNNENFDLIGVDPYFLSRGYAESVTYPYICNTQNRDKFESEVKNRIFWIKSGGGQIRYACANYYPDCTAAELQAIENLLASDTDKRIVMVGQGFMCNQYVGDWNISQIPDICQQQWYYDWSKADPDIEVFLWYKYSSAYYLANTYIPYTEQGKAVCLGVGSHVPNMLDDHVTWGLEVLCGNQDYEPFCTSEGVSYSNPSQAKCDGKDVTQPGGSGSNLCDTVCGADQDCHGLVPGTGGCDDSCQISCYDNYFKVYPSNSGEQHGKYGGDDPADASCCNSDEDCVYQGQCYPEGWHDLDNDSRTDMYCYIPGTYDWWINVDYHQSYCTGRGYHWNVSEGDAMIEDDYYTSTGSRPDYCTIGQSGNPSTECCCGDDSGENYIQKQRYTTEYSGAYYVNWDTPTPDPNDDACCDAQFDCVEGGTCTSQGQLKSWPSWNHTDKLVVCDPANTNKWYDADGGQTHCENRAGLDWAIAGESGVGEYGSLIDGGNGITECCGDDSDEFYNYFNLHWAERGNKYGADNTSDDACCNSDEDCVYQGQCYPEGWHDLDNDQRTDMYCYALAGDFWLNVDYHQSYCTGRGYHWNVGAGDARVESNYYTINTGATRPGYCYSVAGDSPDITPSIDCCCGDDSGEYYVTAGVGPAGCCDNANDCVDGDGVCRIGIEGEFINENGDLSDNCDDGIDNDCDGFLDGNDTDCLNPDLNNDGDINLIDLGIVTSHFGLRNSDPSWNATAEIVPDGVIDVFDLVFVASRFT